MPKDIYERAQEESSKKYRLLEITAEFISLIRAIGTTENSLDADLLELANFADNVEAEISDY